MTKFADLGLDPKVLSAVAEAGYETPTPIQAGAIPPALQGKDVLGIAQTGTGKTASFVLPMVTLLARGRARARMPRSLVLAPTRELAAQVAENFDIYAKNTRLTKALLIGGVSFKEQDALIDRGVDVLIATPGRLLDHFERGKLLLTGVQIMVVDEADRMLDMGFIPDIERIFQMTPFTRQTLFFSATMAPEIERITSTFLHSPAKVEVARAATTGENIAQGVVMFTASRKDRQASEKRKVLRALIDAEGPACSNAIIFCNRKTEVDIVAKSLKKYGYDAAPIHGDLDQSQRTRTLDAFREGKLRFLVASDVAARGLDVPAVSHVFNYDVPSHAEDYVHRIGRTGRAGRSGKALMICVPHDAKWLADIEALTGKPVPVVANPLAGAPAPAESSAESPAAGQEPAAATPESGDEAPRPRRSRGRRGGRSRQAEGSAPEASPVEARSVEVREAPAKVAEKAEPAPEPRAAAEPRRQRGGPDGRNGGGRNNGGGRDVPVLGMGDHVPAFLALTFRRESAPEAAGTEAAADETSDETATENG